MQHNGVIQKPLSLLTTAEQMVRQRKEKKDMQPNGSFCQSCAMPLENTEFFGTNVDGTKSTVYCTYCYQNGKFTEPTITMNQIIEKCVTIMTQQKIMPEDQANPLIRKTIPQLNRWKRN